MQAITRPDGKPIEALDPVPDQHAGHHKPTEHKSGPDGQDAEQEMQRHSVQHDCDGRMHSLTQQMADVTHEMVV